MQRHSLQGWVGGAAIAGLLCAAMGGPSWSATGDGTNNQTIVSNSTKTINHDTNVGVTVNTYETQVLGVDTAYNGGVAALGEDIDSVAKATQTIYNQTFSSAPTSDEVQTAVATAYQMVYDDLNTFGQQAGRSQETMDRYGEIQIDTSLSSQSTSSQSTATTIDSSTARDPVICTFVGPQTIFIGDNQGTSFTLAGGQVDIDVLTITDVNRTITTTTNTDTKSLYQVTGNLFISPIVLNLDGSGKLEASDGQWLPHPRKFSWTHRVLFDFHGNGFPVAMEWVGPHDGLLCRPKPNGTVDGTCLFGTSTGFANGFENMAALDDNMDGRLSGKELKGLFVWQDRNGDGRVQEGEMKSVSEMGITELSIANKNFKSTFTMKGKSCTMYDWWPNTLELRKIKRSV